MLQYSCVKLSNTSSPTPMCVNVFVKYFHCNCIPMLNSIHRITTLFSNTYLSARCALLTCCLRCWFLSVYYQSDVSVVSVSVLLKQCEQYCSYRKTWKVIYDEMTNQLLYCPCWHPLISNWIFVLPIKRIFKRPWSF
jgi:hypothetical protein